MSDTLGLGILFGICFLSVSLALWATVRALEKTSGTSIRSSERERKEFHSLLERFMEKALTASHKQTELSHLHAQERMHSVKESASIEKTIAEPPLKVGKREKEKTEAVGSLEEVTERFK